ncbi:MAG: AlpA family phage regulatory protein [Vicinamibacterales bacterium]|nr:AlpA family phage regulatory protein [Vicinamibacterales bacterium]
MHHTHSTAAPVAANGAPAPITKLPDTGFLRQSQVLAFVPISKSTLWRRVQSRAFPQPVKLSERVTVWRAEDIRHWIANQAGGQRPQGDPPDG